MAAKWKMHPNNKTSDLEKVSPQQAKVLEMQKAYADAFSTSATSSYAEMRAAYREERKMWNSGGPVMAVSQDIAVPFGEDGSTFNVRLLRPTEEPNLPILFFIHGGGFVEGDNDTHGLIQRKLAAYSGCAVVGIDYSLSPEVQYPRAVEECYTAVLYMTSHAAEYGLDASRIGFSGDSGGANLSMATTVYLRDHGFDNSVLKANLLYYGAYGLESSVTHKLHGGPWDGMEETDLDFYWKLYLGDQDPLDCPYYDLYLNDLTYGVPPCFIVAAELDPLCDDSKLLYTILTSKGNPCVFREYAGALHAFLHYSKVMDDAEDALRRGAHFFAEKCGLDPRN